MGNALSGPEVKHVLDQVRATLRFKQYSLRTEEVYVDWIRHYIRLHGHRHPKTMGTKEIEAFLTHLALEHHVTA